MYKLLPYHLQSRDEPMSTYNEDNMVCSINDLFLGGSETTSTTLNWGLLYMVANPDVQGERLSISQISLMQ